MQREDMYLGAIAVFAVLGVLVWIVFDIRPATVAGFAIAGLVMLIALFRPPPKRPTPATA